MADSGSVCTAKSSRSAYAVQVVLKLRMWRKIVGRLDFRRGKPHRKKQSQRAGSISGHYDPPQRSWRLENLEKQPSNEDSLKGSGIQQHICDSDSSLLQKPAQIDIFCAAQLHSSVQSVVSDSITMDYILSDQKNEDESTTSAGEILLTHMCDMRIANEDEGSHLVGDGGVLGVLSAMSAEPLSRQVQRAGLRALRLLISGASDSECRKIAENQGVSVIVDAMSVAEHSSMAQEDGCMALWSLAFFDASMHDVIVRKGGTTAALVAMTTHSKVKTVQLAGAGLIRALTSHVHQARRILDCHGYKVLLDTIELHVLSRTLVEVALGALSNLIKVQESNNVNATGKSVDDVMQLCSNAIEIHPESTDIQKSGTSILRKVRPVCDSFILAAVKT